MCSSTMVDRHGVAFVGGKGILSSCRWWSSPHIYEYYDEIILMLVLKYSIKNIFYASISLMNQYIIFKKKGTYIIK